MSYSSSYGGSADRYREVAVLSASPAQLLTMTYDNLLVNLRRARMAVESGNTELRCEHVARCQDVISELLVTLDHEHGGEIAGNLSALYTFFLRELVQVDSASGVARLDRMTALIQELRDGFSQAATMAAGRTGES